MTRMKALALGVAILAAGAMALPDTASAQRGFHVGGFRGGGWGWRGGGWGGGWRPGWGAAAIGFGIGAAVGAVAASSYYPYGGYGYGYGGGYGYGYPGYAVVYSNCYLVREWGPYGPLVRVCE